MKDFVEALSGFWSGLSATQVTFLLGIATTGVGVVVALLNGYIGTIHKLIDKERWKAANLIALPLVIFLIFILLIGFSFLLWLFFGEHSHNAPGPNPTPAPTIAPSPTPATPLPSPPPNSPPNSPTPTPQSTRATDERQPPGPTPPSPLKLLPALSEEAERGVKENIEHLGTSQALWRVALFFNRTGKRIRLEEYRSTKDWDGRKMDVGGSWLSWKPNNSEALVRFPDEPGGHSYSISNAVVMDHKPDAPGEWKKVPVVVLRRDGEGQLILSLE